MFLIPAGAKLVHGSAWRVMAPASLLNSATIRLFTMASWFTLCSQPLFKSYVAHDLLPQAMLTNMRSAASNYPSILFAI
jgi:hypothetical protein